MSTQAALSYSCSFSSQWKHDIFLSFRGEDTRNSFTSHLYTALTQSGIDVFIDNDLERGKPISPKLLQAIEESRFSVVVFSRNYAASRWCLDELVKIVQCMNTKEQNVFPIFLDVDPSVVRKQTGTFQEAFAKHDETYSKDKEKIQKWRNALTVVANLSGWVLKDRQESEFIRDIVKEISGKLNPSTLIYFEDLVGINSRLGKLVMLIEAGSKDVRMIGICGMGGIGKTTIARIVYELISYEFEVCCFLADVREVSERDGIISLQNQLLSKIIGRTSDNIRNAYDGMREIITKLRWKKCLVVVDDVVNVQQLNELVGKHWFGEGSRIIVTTRDKHLLKQMDAIYEVDLLNNNEARQLFYLKAFDKGQHLEHYRDLSEQVLKYVAGLPLALKVLGSFLLGRTIEEWEDAIERLKNNSENGILDILEISFDGLKEIEKKIFLDISCFFKGKDINYAQRILKACGFNPTIGMSILIDKFLITVEDNRIWMHDLLQEMGRQIVKRESFEPGKRSRLWEEEDVRHVLTKNTGTEIVEGIMLEKELHFSVSSKAFSKMINLRLLKLHGVELPEGLEYLSDKLRLLDWHGYPLKLLPSNVQLDHIVEINMDSSRIKQMWEGVKSFNMLRSICLKDCQNLMQLPNFAMVPNLEKLILKRCPRLHDVHQSLLFHKKVTSLSIISCSSLTTLPNKIHMESLEELELSGCSSLKKFPEIVGSMRCLTSLSLNGTAIEELPTSVEHFTGLYWLKLENCNNLLSLPSTLNNLESLRIMNIYGCANLKNFPIEVLGQVECSRARLSPAYECKEISSSKGVSQKLCSLTKSNLRNCNLEEGSTSRILICEKYRFMDEVDFGNFVLSSDRLSKISGKSQLSNQFYVHKVPQQDENRLQKLRIKRICRQEELNHEVELIDRQQGELNHMVELIDRRQEELNHEVELIVRQQGELNHEVMLMDELPQIQYCVEQNFEYHLRKMELQLQIHEGQKHRSELILALEELKRQIQEQNLCTELVSKQEELNHEVELIDRWQEELNHEVKFINRWQRNLKPEVMLMAELPQIRYRLEQNFECQSEKMELQLQIHEGQKHRSELILELEELKCRIQEQNLRTELIIKQ